MKRLINKIFCLVIILLIFPSLVLPRSLDPEKRISQYRHTIYGAEEGVKDVLDILQDKQGFIWLASYSGLIRFDGSKFVTFNKSTRADFPVNVVRVVFESKDGILWIGSNDGLAKYQNFRFHFYKKEDGLPGNLIRKLFEDSRGLLWIGTSAGLASFDGNTFYSFDALNNKRINFMCEDENGNIWVGVDKPNSVYKINPQTREVKHYDGYLADYITDTPIEFMLKDAFDGSLWAITANTLLKLKNEKVIKAYPVDEMGFSSKFVNLARIFQDKKGGLWLSSHAGIIRFYNEKFSIFSKKEGLSDDAVTSIYQDREGNIWAGTRPGLDKFSESKFTVFSQKDGLLDESINAVLDNGNGEYWIATNDGVSILKREGDLAIIENIKSNKLKAQIKQVYKDKKGIIWVSTYGLGLVQFKDKKMTKVLTTDEGLVGDKVRLTFEDSQGNLWVGTKTGISRIRPSGSIDNFTGKNGLTNETILCFYEDKQGRIWVGTNGGGINIFDKGKVTQVYREEHGLLSDVVFRFYEDSNGALWITTSDGINYLHNNQFSKLTTEQGLLSDVVFQIIEDAQGRFWMNTTEGLFYAFRKEMEAVIKGEKEHFEIVLFDKHSGLQEVPSAVSWGITDSHGHLWFPTYGGVATINPNNIFQNTIPPPVVILDNLVIDNKKNLLFEPQKTLEAGTKRVELFFAALSYVVPEKTLFQFKLEGFDNEWSDLTRKQETIYTNLPYGEYTFKVKALNNDGVWSVKNAELAIYKKPFFYETTWFLVFSIFILITIVLMIAYKIHRIRIKKYETRLKRQKEQTELERKAKEVERTAKEREMRLNVAYDRFVPHEFLNILEKESIIEVQLGDQVEKEMTILFSDIRGFTSMSEKLTPKETFNFINTYLSEMEPSIHKYSGFIDKYIGDAIMALFPTNADDALKGAIDMTKHLRMYNHQRLQQKMPPINIGIGLNTGKLMLGTVGGQRRMDGTVISDAVNLSSRIEGLTKLYGVMILITGKTYNRLTNPADFNFRTIDRVTVKGKTEPVTIFEVLDGLPDNLLKARLKSKTNFEKGMKHYHNQEFAQAKVLFQKCLSHDFSDKVVQIYVKRCQENM